MKSIKKVVLAFLALAMLFSGASVHGPVANVVQANDLARCVGRNHWRVNQAGDTNVRWQANGANAGSIFLNATLVENGNTLTQAGGFGWHRGFIGGPGNSHNGWAGNTMWAVRARFAFVRHEPAC